MSDGVNGNALQKRGIWRIFSIKHHNNDLDDDDDDCDNYDYDNDDNDNYMWLLYII